MGNPGIVAVFHDYYAAPFGAFAAYDANLDIVEFGPRTTADGENHIPVVLEGFTGRMGRLDLAPE